MKPRGPRLCRVPPGPGPAPGPAPVSAWKPHKDAVAAPQGLWQLHKGCGSSTGAAAALQQHNRACSCFQQHNEACRCLNQPLQTGQERPKITVSGMNGPKIHPHGLSLCVRGAVGLRMPLACLTGQKTQKIAKKTGFSGSGGSGRGPPRGPACAPLRAALRCGSVRCSLRSDSRDSPAGPPNTLGNADA